MAERKKKVHTVQMSGTLKALKEELLKFEKSEKRKAKRDKATGDIDMSWINGYVSGAQFVLSHIVGY